MKRVMVGALTLALMLGAVGCGEEKNDNAMIIGGADAFGAEEIIVTPQEYRKRQHTNITM